jgi:bifunctional non-homologous end joining protein LigD
VRGSKVRGCARCAGARFEGARVRAAACPAIAAERRRRARYAAGVEAIVAGVRISHPERVIYPDLGIRKIDLAAFYEAIAEWVVPHVAGRPLTLVHCPNGLAGRCAYMRHTRVWGPAALRRVNIREQTKVGEYLVADDGAGIVALIQMGIVEFHTWNVLTDDIERPNRVIWDLDPGDDVAWRQVVEAAHAVRDVLRTLGLQSWVKTTGGRGLHVVMPIARHRDWSECLTFSRAVAEALARHSPARYTTAFARSGRTSKILIDYLRNNRTNTSVSAFSARARPGATVSVPLAWDELTPRLRPDSFTIRTLSRRLARIPDPWRDYWTCRQRIRAAAFDAIQRVDG